MKIAVCDDEEYTREHIGQMIKKQIPAAEVQLFASGEELITAQINFDIFFLDIEMEKISGIETARKIRESETGRNSILIFVTGYRDYMEEAFDVHAYHYLIKPINQEKFARVLENAAKEVHQTEDIAEKFIVLKSSGVSRKVPVSHISYIESSNRKVIFHTKSGLLECYGKMEEMEKVLGSTFYRCHRCYLVNIEKICSYTTDTIQLVGGEKLILAQKKYPEFVKTYLRYAKDGGIVNV